MTGTDRPNILLVVMDSVRAKSTSLHDCDRNTTPFLSTFADRATHYTQARAPGANSLTSHTSLFTGYRVAEHRLYDTDQSLQSDATIWATLRDEGYETGVFSSNAFVTEVDVGLKDAFETVVTGSRESLPFSAAVDPREYTDAFSNDVDYLQFAMDALRAGTPVRSVLNGLSLQLEDMGYDLPEPLATRSRSADVYVDAFLNWHAERGGPWAACINFMDAHLPYEPDSEFDEWATAGAHELMSDVEQGVWTYPGGQRSWDEKDTLLDLYHGCVRQVDAAIEQVVSGLERRGDLDSTMVVVLADHGEGFGEESEIRDTRASAHGSSGGPEEEILHVPLLVKYPDQTTGAVVDDAVSIRAFPAVAEAVATTDDVSTDAFVSDSPVVATVTGLQTLGSGRAERYLDEEALALYRPETKVRYDDADKGVHKRLVWDGLVEKYEILDAQTRHSLSSTPRDRELVLEAFEDIRDPGITDEQSHEEAVDDAVQQRLEDLGYA